MRSLPVAAVLSLVLLAPLTSRAQIEAEAAAPLEDRPAVKLNEVERGVFFSAETGGMLLFGPEGSAGSGLSFGRSLGVTVGSDIGDLMSVALMVMGTQVDTPSEFRSPGGMGGDFSSLVVGAVVQLALHARADANGFKRFFVHGRAGGGLGLMGPKDFYDGSDVVLFGGAGIEYYTRLRHFSVGLNADFLFGLSNLGPGIVLSPTLRYTF